MTDYTPGFEKWWSLYPRTRRKDKIKCFEKWKKHKLEDRVDEVVKKLEADVAYDWYDKELKFIPLSHTYLNGGRFDDDLPRPPRAMPQPREDVIEEETKLNKWQSMANRWLLAWLRVAGGVPDIRPALKVKNDTIKEMSAPLDEDLAAAEWSKAAQHEASWTFVSVLLDRLDLQFERNIKPKLLSGANHDPESRNH